MQSHPKAVFISANVIYKVHENISLMFRSKTRFVGTTDTRDGSSFIEHQRIPLGIISRIGKLTHEENIRNSIAKTIPIVRTVDLMVHIRTSTEVCSFYVADNIATELIIGCNFCYFLVGTINLRLNIVKMDDGSKVPIVGQTSYPIADVQIHKEEQHSSTKTAEGYQVETGNPSVG